jgi:hypothetical protein
MTYASGSSILAADYNTFVQGGAGVNHAVANVNSIWGVGSGDKGWGQSGTLAPVSAGGPILASQWTALTARMNTIKLHQTGTSYTISNGPAIVPGAIITAVTNLPTTLSTLYTNRFNLTNAYQRSSNTYQSSATSWSSYVRHTILAQFADPESIRYFFNTGSTLQFSFTNTSAAGDGINWMELGIDCGLITYGANSTTQSGDGDRGAGPTILTTTEGYYQTIQFGSYLPPTTIFQQSGQGGATNYYIKVTAEESASVFPVIKFVVEYRDTVPGGTRSGYPRTGFKVFTPPTNELGIDYGPFYLTNTWGTVLRSATYTSA